MLKQKNLIFIGAPGAGKGTISGILLAIVIALMSLLQFKMMGVDVEY